MVNYAFENKQGQNVSSIEVQEVSEVTFLGVDQPQNPDEQLMANIQTLIFRLNKIEDLINSFKWSHPDLGMSHNFPVEKCSSTIDLKRKAFILT